MAKLLTDRKKQILIYISDFIAKGGISPSLHDIATHFNIKPPAVQKHLEALAKKGEIEYEKGKVRSIKILNEKYKTHTHFLALPYFDKIPSLKEFSEYETQERYFLSTKDLDTTKDYFAVKYTSNDLDNLKILQGDILIFEKTEEEIQNSYVIATRSYNSDAELVIRKFVRLNDKIVLQTENDSIGMTSVTSCTICGILAFMIRSYHYNAR